MKQNISIVRNLVIKQLKLKYKQSALGFLWSLLTPLAFLLIINFVFSQAFLTIKNYPLYVLTGLIFWQFFSNATNQSIQSFIHNASIIKTINVKIELFPIAAVCAEVVALLFSFIPFLTLMYFFGLSFSWHFLLLIPALIIFSTFAYSLGIILGILNVFLRDVSILWNTLNPALFYLSPIAYNISIIPKNYLFFLKLNPLFHFFDVFRAILYQNSFPSTESWLIILSLTIGLYFISKLVVYKLEKGIISTI
jgi:ABC-type polysaccharide/polyol phosphate export permease